VAAAPAVSTTIRVLIPSIGTFSCGVRLAGSPREDREDHLGIGRGAQQYNPAHLRGRVAALMDAPHTRTNPEWMSIALNTISDLGHFNRSRRADRIGLIARRWTIIS
jgi:hypothetical protein